MALITINKDKAVVEDLELGMDTVEQERGTGTQLNSGNLPYSASESTTQAINRKEDTTSLTTKLAAKADLNGSISQAFKVAIASDNEDAVRLAQMVAELVLKADITYVDDEVALKSDEENVLLKDGTSPDFTPVSPNQPATKRYIDDLVIDAGAGDMLKSEYDIDDTGAVDTSEAIGRVGTFLGQTPMNQVMRLSQSNVTDCNILGDFGFYVGTDVANAPSNGQIMVEQFQIGGNKSQRSFVFNSTKWYYRAYNGSIWSGWAELVDTNKLINDLYTKVSKSGDTMTGNLTIGGSSTPRIKLSPHNDVGFPQIEFTDSLNATIALIYTKSSNGDIVIRRHIDDVGVYFELTMLANGNVAVVNGAPAPTNTNELTRKDYVDNQVTQAQVPIGGIILYDGLVSAIPSNYQLLNMNNVVIVATNVEGEFGNTGGSNNAVVVSHSHTFTGDLMPEHDHDANASGTSTLTPIGRFKTGDNNNGLDTLAIRGTSAGTPSGTISTNGVSGTNANMQAYVKMGYIKRIS